MRYAEFCRMSMAAQRAHSKARCITELLLIRRDMEWARLTRTVWLHQTAAWLRTKRKDALILLGIVVGDLIALQLLVHWIITWR